MSENPLSSYLIPKKETQSDEFLKKYDIDGEGILVAVLDSGIDPCCKTLQKTPSGSPKVLDFLDSTDSGTIETTTIVSRSNHTLKSPFSQKEYIIPPDLHNINSFHFGYTDLSSLYPKCLKNRLKGLWRKEFERKSNNIPQLHDFSLFEFTELSDIIVYEKGNEYYCYVILFTDDILALSEYKAIRNYNIAYEYNTVSDSSKFNYTVNIAEKGNLVSIIAPNNSHGTHVANILAGYDEKDDKYNGIAPGAQILSIKIADSRLAVDGMETNSSIVKALLLLKKYVKSHKLAIVNYSFGEPSNSCNEGIFKEILDKLIFEDNVLFCASGGNSGPCISTVSAPGSIYSYTFGIGAYLNNNMMKYQYFLAYDSKFPLMQTWSGCGPAPDGDRGISFCAPASAICSVPEYNLVKNTLKNGTSMSSPIAAGNLALLLSYMKNNGLKWSFPYIEKCINNSCLKIPGHSRLQQGSGLLQICDALEYCLKYPLQKEEDFKFKISVNFGYRGIYERNFTKTTEYNVSIRPLFRESCNDVKLNFEKHIVLKCDSEFVIYPKEMIITNENVPFKVSVEFKKSENKLDYTEILGYFKDREEEGSVFRIPVTLIRPIKFDSRNFKFPVELNKNTSTSRTFLLVPLNVSYCQVNLKVLQFSGTKQKIGIEVMQLVNKTKFSISKKRKSFEIYEKDQITQFGLTVFSGQTLEIVIINDWKTQGDVKLEVKVTVGGVDIKDVMMKSTIEPFYVNPQIVSIQTLFFKVNFRQLIRRISPSNFTSTTKKELLHPFDNRVLHELLLKYKLKLSACKDVVVHLPMLHDILYESKIISTLLFVYNNKRLIKVLDFNSLDEKFKLQKGDVSLHVKLSSFSKEDLDKLKSTFVNVIFSIPTVRGGVYDTFDNALMRKSPVETFTMKINRIKRFFISLDHLKIPKFAKNGDILVGNLKFLLGNYNKRKVYYSIVKPGKCVSVPSVPLVHPPKKPDNVKNITNVQNELTMIKLKYFEDHSNVEEVKEMIREFADKTPDNVRGLKLLLRTFDDNEYKKKIDCCDRIIELIDQTKIISEYFDKVGNVSAGIAKDMDDIIFALYKKTKYSLFHFIEDKKKFDEMKEVKSEEKKTKVAEKDEEVNIMEKKEENIKEIDVEENEVKDVIKEEDNEKENKSSKETKEEDNREKSTSQNELEARKSEINKYLKELKNWTLRHSNGLSKHKFSLLSAKVDFYVNEDYVNCFKLVCKLPLSLDRKVYDFLIEVVTHQKNGWEFLSDYLKNERISRFPAKCKHIY